MRAEKISPQEALTDTPVAGVSFKQHSVLIVDADPVVRDLLNRGLQQQFGLVEVADTIDTADAIWQRCNFDLIILEASLSAGSAISWAGDLRDNGSTTAVIFIAEQADLALAVEALRAGAADFILKPLQMEALLNSIARCLELQQLQRDNLVIHREFEHAHDHGIIGDSDSIDAVIHVIERVGPMQSTVLIEGESGTGKELAARAIHDYSGRGGSFVPVNCGAISSELLESELFGHIKGAFTGAHQARDGLFTYANGGSVFLDEIGEMPLSMQVHLLRVLEEGSIRPVGANREVPVDVRVIAATNRDLSSQVEQGRFREDLFYRLNVVKLRMPPLRERQQDIPLLADFFMRSLSADMGIAPHPIGDPEVTYLKSYDWPGNVRELKNVIERCLLLNQGPEQCLYGSSVPASRKQVADEPEETRLAEIEKRHILKVLDQQQGNKSAAARKLGISRKTLERKLQAWQQ
jgi:two-component system NtrC family response regulator